MERRRLILYALPALALAMPTIPVYVYLPTFYAESLGVGLAATGFSLLVARILDVVSDPLVGLASDRLRTRWGRRKPWIAAGCVLAAVALVALLQPPGTVTATYLALWAMLLYLGWTMVSIPYTAWGAELSDEYHQRGRITGAREGMMLLGVVIAGGVPAAVAAFGGNQQDGLAAVAWLTVAAGAPTVLLLLWRVPEAAIAHPAAPLPRNRWRAMVEVARNRPFVRLLSAWFVDGLANGLPAVLLPLYLQHVLGASEVEGGILIVAYFVAAIAAIPLWLHLSRRIGKHRAWCCAMGLACAAFVWVPLLQSGAVELFFVICVITGMALGADLALPPAMQADVVDLDRLRTGRQRAGLFFALWNMATKLALAGAVAVAFPALDWFGFRLGGENLPGALLALALIYAGVPTVLKLIAIGMVWGHPITARKQAAIQRRLKARSGRQYLANRQ
jgi:Na+/melibiose symporter-like transporter